MSRALKAIAAQKVICNICYTLVNLSHSANFNRWPCLNIRKAYTRGAKTRAMRSHPTALEKQVMKTCNTTYSLRVTRQRFQILTAEPLATRQSHPED